jgi:hypothetical protein
MMQMRNVNIEPSTDFIFVLPYKLTITGTPNISKVSIKSLTELELKYFLKIEVFAGII